MASFNKVILMGNLTRDPQLSYLPSQTAVVEFGLAVNRKWKGQDGQQREDTCFVDCRAYGRQAETLNQYMSKGRPLLVEGRLQFDSWESKDGQKRSKHRVVVESFQFLGGGGGGAAQPRREQMAPSKADESGSNSEPAPSSPPDMPSGDDIPF